MNLIPIGSGSCPCINPYASFAAGRGGARADRVESISPVPRSQQDAVRNRIDQRTADVFGAVDSFLNLGDPNRAAAFFKLSGEDREKFAQILAALVKKGVVGYEVLEIEGEPQPRKMAIDMQIGDEKARRAKLYDHNARAVPQPNSPAPYHQFISDSTNFVPHNAKLNLVA